MQSQNENMLIKKLAKEFDFDVCRVTDPKLELKIGLRLKEFIDLGFHGDMKWIEETYERRKSPLNLWPEDKTSIILGVNEIYKEHQETALMDLMKRLTVIKKKIEVRLKGRSQS